MKKKLPILLLFWFSCVHATANDTGYKPLRFIIKSSKNIGTIYVAEPYYKKKYFASCGLNDSSSYYNGEYSFSGKILYPTAIRIFQMDGEKKINQIVFVDTGTNYFSILYSKYDAQVHSKSSIEKEHKLFLETTGLSDLNNKVPMKEFESFTNKYPNSYIGLFVLINQQFNYRTTPEMRKIATNMGLVIRSTDAFKNFYDDYLKENKFNPVEVTNKKGHKVVLKVRNEKFLLIDFWFSGCTGCFWEMDKLKNEFRELSKKIEIVSINTDSEKEIRRTYKLFKKMNLPWSCFWDFDEKYFKNYVEFYKYPMNMLIDRDGNVVAIDVDINRLSDFTVN